MISTPLRTTNGGRSGEVTMLSAGHPAAASFERTALANLISDSAPVASWDPALVGFANDDWDRAEVDPARANILRALTLDAGSVVLELGARSGAVTRYLGEVCARVDALEPDASLAALAARRTHDLESVRVFSGDVYDVPATATYDLVVAIDALRFETDRAKFLEAAGRLLRPGGSLVLAETNRIGARYLAGAPDDVTGIVFDSIEGYPSGSAPHALTRSELEQAIDAAGYGSHFLVALPDHTGARAVLDPERLTGASATLLSDLAITPSPDRGAPRPRLSDETRLWAQLCSAGLAAELANSFVVIVTRTAGAARTIWPDGRAGVYFSWGRRAEYTATTVISQTPRGLVLDREYPHADPQLPLRVHDSREAFVEGDNLIDLMVQADDDGLREYLRLWRETLDSLSTDAETWLDVHPGNLILTADRSVVAIDREFAATTADPDFALRRGLLTSARAVAMASAPSRWPSTFSTLEDVVAHFGELLGLRRSSGWIAKTVADEAEFQREIAGPRAGSKPDAFWHSELRTMLKTPLLFLPLGTRSFDTLDAIIAERDTAFRRLGAADRRIRVLETEILTESERSTRERAALSDHIASLENHLEHTSTRLRGEVDAARQQLAVVQSSRSYRAARRASSALARVLPIGSRRRRFAGRLARVIRLH